MQYPRSQTIRNPIECRMRVVQLNISEAMLACTVRGSRMMRVLMKRTFAATLHHLIVALLVGGDENDLGSKALPCVLEELHGVWSPASFLRVPQNHSLGLDMFVDQTSYGWSKGFLLIRAYPNEEPGRVSVKNNNNNKNT